MSTDLEERNRSAILQRFAEQNTKMNKMQDTINTLNTQVSMLNRALAEIKQQNAQQLAQQFGSGPTAS